MVGLTPICRLKWLRDVNPKVTEIVQKLLDQYDRFLTTTDATDTALQERFANREVARSLSEDALTLGNLMFSALGQVGNVEGGGSDFYRLLVV